MKISEFFQGAEGEASSKRLGYLSNVPVASLGTLWICYLLIQAGQFYAAVTLWTSYLIYSAVLGGFVSAELIPTILLSVRGIKNNKESKDVQNNT